jgi:hypothetical protein
LSENRLAKTSTRHATSINYKTSSADNRSFASSWPLGESKSFSEKNEKSLIDPKTNKGRQKFNLHRDSLIGEIHLDP